MSSLKVIKARMRSVNNTKKISQTMRLVSAAKYARAEKELTAIRPFGHSPQNFFDAIEVIPIAEQESELYIAITGDRGLCGAIHSGIARAVGRTFNKLPQDQKNSTNLICVGEKNKAILSRSFAKNIIWVASDVSKKPATFIDAGYIAEEIMATMEEESLSTAQVFYNQFVNASSYQVEILDLYNRTAIFEAPKFPLYDGVNEEIMDCWLEFSLASMIFWVLKEGLTSELSARMIAMENATRNAEDMVKQLELKYNRTRQAVITGELIEIISGASAIK